MFLDELNPVKVFRQFVGTLFRAFPANWNRINLWIKQQAAPHHVYNARNVARCEDDDSGGAWGTSFTSDPVPPRTFLRTHN